MGKHARPARSLTAAPSLTARRVGPSRQTTTATWSPTRIGGRSHHRTPMVCLGSRSAQALCRYQSWRQLTATGHPIPVAQPLGKGGVAAPDALGADRPGQRALAADQHHQPPARVTAV
jgi:hypothetical protein